MESVRRVETAEQIAAVVEIGRAFHDYSIWRETPYAPEDVRAMVEGLVSGPGAVWVSRRGICGVVLSPLWFNKAVTIAVELFWYAEDGQGAALREAAERWAAEAGAAFVQISGLADEREPALRRLLARAGHQPKEVAFMKRLA